MESDCFSIDQSSSLNLDERNLLLDSELPFSKDAINSALTVIDDEGDGDLSFVVDSDGLVSEPGVSLVLDGNDQNMDILPDSSFFSESEFFSGSFENKDDSHGFNVDSSFGFSNNFSGLGMEPGFN